MKYSREIADTTEKGQCRYNLYKSVIGRYLQAMDAGYYLEAITLMESLIMDRLDSALIYYGLSEQEFDFRTLATSLRELNAEGLITDDLYSAIDKWRIARNRALHNMAKIAVGESPVFNIRYEEQKDVAEMGYFLFKKLKEEIHK